MYNVRVADFHTYFVAGAETWAFSVWAHNASYAVLPGVAGPRGLKILDVRQDHHAIPYDNKKYAHQKHGLVAAAGNPKLETLPSNLRSVEGHAGRHSSAYHAEVRRRMDAGLDKLDAYRDRLVADGVAADRVAARVERYAQRQVDRIIEGAWRDIGAGALPLYVTKDVRL